MSLVYLKKSAIFQDPELTSHKIWVRQLLDGHKQKLKINNRCISKPVQKKTEKLSLGQALKLENLHSQTTRVRKASIHGLFKGYEQNCTENLNQEEDRIDNQRLGLFRQGIYYRSSQRARGAGVTQGFKTEHFITDDLQTEEEIEKMKPLKRHKQLKSQLFTTK